jgi:VanZ family protein
MALIFRLSATPDLRTVPWAQRFHLLPMLMGAAATNLLEFVLRKTAHMAAYATLVLLLRWALAGWRTRWSPRLLTLTALGLTILYAISDEWHQTFVPTREGTPRDVAIDTCGALIALFLMWLLQQRRKRTAK